MIKILIAEDEEPIANLIRMNLTRAGYNCTWAADGMEAADLMQQRPFDLALLDIMLPGCNGYELLQYAQSMGLPVIFLTALGTTENKVKGLKMGADDYLAKPFAIPELLARVETVLRRYHKAEGILKVFDITIDTASRLVLRDGQQIALTLKEFDLLLLLARNRNIALYRETIYESVWGGEYEGQSRTIDLHVQRLKKKLGWNEEITAVYKVGYRLEARIKKNEIYREALLWIMILTTAAFIAFGMWMLDSSFSRMLEQERQQASQEIRMFQYFLEVGYQSGEEYGQVYALQKAIESMTINVDRTGSRCIVLDEEGVCHSGQQELEQLSAIADVDRMLEERNGAGENNYVWQLCEGNQGRELVSMCDSMLGERRYYLLVSRNIQGIYEERAETVRQYRIMLLVLLAITAVCAWVLARYLTRPIRRLGWVTKRIAAGDLTRRSDYHRPDEVGELAESFNLMADRLVEQMREKELEAKRQEDFTAAFAHELKTPLTSIIGYAQMLDTMELGPEDHRTASHYIFTQGKRLEQLSHKLLELVSMEKQDFAVKPIKALALGENLWTTMRPIWESRRIQGSIRMEKAMLWGDIDLLLSLLYNLLDNATKAVGEKGQISLEGRCIREVQAADSLEDFDNPQWDAMGSSVQSDGINEYAREEEISSHSGRKKGKTGRKVQAAGAETGEKHEKWYGIRIRDNGRGIPQEEIDRITEPFYMVDKSRSRKEGGAGLGMSLCQRILQLHRGSWKMKSTLGEGTEILIRLPLTPPD